MSSLLTATRLCLGGSMIGAAIGDIVLGVSLNSQWLGALTGFFLVAAFFNNELFDKRPTAAADGGGK